jgi:hypothetical protein
MLKKYVALSVDEKTFPKKKVPPYLHTSGAVVLDITEALLMLGTISVPGGFSTASPARFWAWVRYFSAISSQADLRIIQEFSDLDPHQKTILSDDFGVAVGTKLLYDQLGGLRDIVDGRRFILQYSSLLRASKKKQKRRPPKVGPNKCPDFVLLDRNDKWHVLECKGTQTSAYYRDKQLKTAMNQKFAIEVKNTVAGSRLAAGLFLTDDRANEESSVRIVDPEPEPYVVLDDQDTALQVQRRLAISRALGFAGYAALADELAMPSLVDERDFQLLNRQERRRTAVPVSERLGAATRTLSFRQTASFDDDIGSFRGQKISVDLPTSPFSDFQGARSVEVNVGVNIHLIERLQQIDPSDPHFLREVEERSNRNFDDGIVLESSDTEVTMHYGHLFAARMRFT